VFTGAREEEENAKCAQYDLLAPYKQRTYLLSLFALSYS
jgi:hypothetical protein